MHAPVRERGRRQEGEGDAGADDLWPEISKRILHSGLPILLLGKYSVRGLEAVSSNYRFFHSIHLKLNLFPHLNVMFSLGDAISQRTKNPRLTSYYLAKVVNE